MNQKISVIAGLTRQQQDTRQRLGRCFLGMIVAGLLAAIAPELAFAGASPFASGATAVTIGRGYTPALFSCSIYAAATRFCSSFE